MVNNQRQVSAVFAALSDPTRRGILSRLSAVQETRVSALASPFRISAPAISRHLRVLERARLIHRRRHGREHLIRPRPDGLDKARAWITHCAAGWEFSFNALDELLKSAQGASPAPPFEGATRKLQAARTPVLREFLKSSNKAKEENT
jgi:DNA-binding transcriptional ArsR family regulator